MYLGLNILLYENFLVKHISKKLDAESLLLGKWIKHLQKTIFCYHGFETIFAMTAFLLSVIHNYLNTWIYVCWMWEAETLQQC